MISKLTNTDKFESVISKLDTDGSIEIPYGKFLFDADFSRNGQDLILSNNFDQQITLDGYFSSKPYSALSNEFGAKIDGNLVSKLAGPGQVAQAGSSEASLGEPVGTIETLSGTATVQHANGVSETLEQGSSIYKNDVIETADGTNMGLLMGDGSVMGIGSNSRMVIDEYAYDPESGDGALGMSFLKGTMSFLSGKIAKNDYDDVDLKVPFGSIGIRGTEFIVDIKEDGSATISVIDGSVATLQDGSEVVLTPGQLVTLRSSGFSIVELIAIAAIQARYSAILAAQNKVTVIRDREASEGEGDDENPEIQDTPGEGIEGTNGEQEAQTAPPPLPEEAFLSEEELEALLPEDLLAILGELTDLIEGALPEEPPLEGPLGDEPPLDGILAEDLQPPATGNIFTGTAGADQLTGTTANDMLSGGGGNDVIIGGAGNDTLEGGPGDDTLDGGDGNDLILTGSNVDGDRVIGGLGDDTIDVASTSGFFSIHYGGLTGGITADLSGTSATVVKNAGGTDEILNLDQINTDSANAHSGFAILGSQGNDSITGFDFNDVLQVFIGNEGNDTIVGGSNSIDEIDYATSIDGVTVVMSSVTQGSGTTTDDGFNNTGMDIFSGIEEVSGSNFNDSLVGSSFDDNFSGRGGDDTIEGNGGFDYVIYDRDTVSTGINANLAASSISDGAGGTDFVTSIEGVIGSGTEDTIVGSAAAESFEGRSGHDILDGAGGNDTLFGDDGNDSINGGAGTDILHGDTGDDTLIGDADNDTLFGGDAADILWGGFGDDEMFGGNGVDTFYFESISEIANEGMDLAFSGTANHIMDFVTTVDKITLDSSNFFFTGGYVAADDFLTTGSVPYDGTNAIFGGANTSEAKLIFDGTYLYYDSLPASVGYSVIAQIDDPITGTDIVSMTLSL